MFIQDMAWQVNLLDVALLMTYEVSPSWMSKKLSCFHAHNMVFETYAIKTSFGQGVPLFRNISSSEKGMT